MAGNAIREALEPISKIAEFFADEQEWRDHDAIMVAPMENLREAQHLTVGDLRRARTAYDAIGSGVKVRALEWDEHGSAKALGLRYEVWLHRDVADGYKERWLAAQINGATDRLGGFDSRDEAKAAAQADFERRVLSCLSPVAVEEADAKAERKGHTPSDEEMDEATIRQRDIAEDAADKLAEAIGELLGVNVGEHSSAHSPWETALEHAGQAVRNRAPSTHTAAGAGPVGEALAFVMQYGGRCRDCGDCNGYCQDEGLPCNSAHRERIIRHVLEAVEYGRAHGFLARPVEEPGEVERLTRERDAQYDENVNRIAAEGVAVLRAEAAEAALAESEQNAQGLASDLAATQAELDEMRAALVQIEGGHFPGAADVAISGSWQVAVNQLQGIARAALTGDAQDGEPGASFGARHSIAHDGFVGTVIGHYTRLDGKRGVVLQQDGTKVVHVYGEKWLAPAGDAQEARRSPDVSMWGRWFPHDEAPGGSYACLYRNGELPVSLAWMPAQGRPNMPDTVVMPFPMPGDAQEAGR